MTQQDWPSCVREIADTTEEKTFKTSTCCYTVGTCVFPCGGGEANPVRQAFVMPKWSSQHTPIRRKATLNSGTVVETPAFSYCNFQTCPMTVNDVWCDEELENDFGSFDDDDPNDEAPEYGCHDFGFRRNTSVSQKTLDKYHLTKAAWDELCDYLEWYWHTGECSQCE